MSGGVGPTCDITFPKAELRERESRWRSLFSFRQLNALAAVIVLSASGMVNTLDLGFVFFSIFYMHFIARVAFPPTSAEPEPAVFGENNKILSAYVVAGAVIGLFLPIAYIFHGMYEGDREGMKAAAPHVFLLASQVFMEGVSFAWRFSLPVRVFVPVFYNSMRILTILEWVRTEISKASSSTSTRLKVGKALALANMAFWSFNLFAFYCPFISPGPSRFTTTKLRIEFSFSFRFSTQIYVNF